MAVPIADTLPPAHDALHSLLDTNLGRPMPPRRRNRLVRPSLVAGCLTTLLLPLARPGAIGAQDTLVSPDSARAALARADTTRRSDLACVGRTVTDVEIRREAPRVLRRGPAWWRATLASIVQHRTTRPEVVSDFLRLREGSTCTPLDRDETERVLRAQPFLADARVRAEPDAAGRGARLVVETVDEIPLILGLSFGGGDVTSFRYGNSNVGGAGQLASLQWRQGRAFRDGLAARYQHYHILNGPNTLTAQAERAPLGGNVLLSVAHPFLTPLQRVALQAEYREENGYRTFRRADQPTRSLAVRRDQISSGAVYRIARIGGGALSGVFAGAVGTYERVKTGDESVHIDDDGLTPDPDPGLVARYGDFDRTRAAAVLGVTALDFLTVRGFDALEGAQDVGRGVQVTLRGGPQSGVDDARAFAGVDVYAGAGGPTSFVGLRFDLEGESGSEGEVITSGRIAWYRRPAARRTLVISGEYSGAWNSRVPYQLTFADRRGGLIGYRKSDLGGARRLVGRGEHRWSFRRGSSSLLGFGGAVFAQVGKTWEGDVPYGVTTTGRGSVGVGLLAALPRASRRLLRADVAFPLSIDPGVKRVEFRFTSSVPVRSFWREPSDIAAARSAAPSTDLFTWP